MKEMNLVLSLLFFFASLVFSSLLVPLLQKIALKYSVVDTPNQSHKTHQASVPYLGGFAIIIPVLLFAILGPIIFIEDSDYAFRVSLTIIPSIILAFVGLYDDIKNSSAQLRFLFQSTIASALTLYLSFLGYSVSIVGNEIGDFLLSIFWLVGITNAINFFDNLDGGAAGITLIASFTLFLLAFWGNQFLIASLSLVVAGASVGFLIWNRSPARIYLGDSGALFIGFILAASILQFEPRVESRFASALIPVFVLALPIIDTTVAVVSRISRGVSIFQSGQDHLSHRLIARGLSKKNAAYLLWLLASIISSLTFFISSVPKNTAFGISLLGLFFMGLLVIWFIKMENYN